MKRRNFVKNIAAFAALISTPLSLIGGRSKVKNSYLLLDNGRKKLSIKLDKMILKWDNQHSNLIFFEGEMVNAHYLLFAFFNDDVYINNKQIKFMGKFLQENIIFKGCGYIIDVVNFYPDNNKVCITINCIDGDVHESA